MSKPDSNKTPTIAPDLGGEDVRCTLERSGHADNDQQWDAFLASLHRAHHEQTSGWARLKASQGWKSVRVVCRDGREVVGGAQLLFHQIRPFGVVGYVPWGPCMAETPPGSFQAVVQHLLLAAREAGVWYLAIELPDFGQPLIPHCVSSGMWPKPADFPPTGIMEATSLLDLALPEPELLARMRSSTRRNIRQGRQRGVTVREGTEKDLDTFFNLMLATARRRGETPTPSNPRFFERFWHEFHPRGWLRLSIAECEGEPVCAEFAVPFSDTHRLWKFGWSGRFRERNPSDVICWDSITWAKRRGFKQLDLVQVDPVVVNAVVNGQSMRPEVMARRLYGPTMHKVGFGGQIVRLPGTYCCFLHPMLNVLNPAFRNPRMRRIGAGLASSIARLTWRTSANSR